MKLFAYLASIASYSTRSSRPAKYANQVGALLWLKVYDRCVLATIEMQSRPRDSIPFPWNAPGMLAPPVAATRIWINQIRPESISWLAFRCAHQKSGKNNFQRILGPNSECSLEIKYLRKKTWSQSVKFDNWRAKLLLVVWRNLSYVSL